MLTPARPPLKPRIRFDLTTIRLFIATAEHGSITGASAEQCLAVAAVSRRIAELENQFGVPLFNRLPHGMALTDAGRSLLAHARSMMHAVERMHDDASAYLHGDKGVVRIAACTSAVLQFLPGDISRFQALHPDIHIDLQEQTSNGVVKLMAQGLADIGVFESSISGPPLATQSYRGDELVVVTPAGHALAVCERLRIAEVLPYEFVGLSEGTAIAATLQRAAAKYGVTLRNRIRVTSFDSMLAMIRAGIGVGLMPRAVADLFAATDEFRRIPLDEPWTARQFVLCRQAVGDMSSAAVTVAEFLALAGAPVSQDANAASRNRR